MQTTTYPYYLIWSGALNLGKTPGVFDDASFAGTIVQLPITINSMSVDTPLEIVLTTVDLQLLNGNSHSVHFDWKPGDPLNAPVGLINDTDRFQGIPGKHLLTSPHDAAGIGTHTITIIFNPDVPAGGRYGFVLKRVECNESFDTKFGW